LDEKEIEELRVTAVDCKEKLQSRTDECPLPAVANHKLDVNFKYGRFCGTGYPRLTHSSRKNENKLSDLERRELARDYYRIKPIDDIDIACQAHDICWTLNPGNKVMCNEYFEKNLSDLRKKWKEQIGLFDTDTVQLRCSAFALDMSYAATVLMQHNSTDKAEEVGVSIGKFNTAPLTVIYAELFVAANALDHWPHSDELCLNDKDDKGPGSFTQKSVSSAARSLGFMGVLGMFLTP
jgi:hypothetical protein